MSDTDLQQTQAEREEEERRRREGRPPLDEEIARKYDAQRLSKIVVRGAGQGESLDLSTRGEMERRLPGYDFSSVRVYRGPLAEEVTRRYQADAITVSNTGMILMRDSARSAPGTTTGQALLAHELTHVAQAQRGMLFAKEQGGGQGAHEEEAEEVEAGVKGGDDGGKKDTKEEAGSGLRHGAKDASDEGRRVEAKRKKVIDRAIEMLQEHVRNSNDRRGLEHA